MEICVSAGLLTGFVFDAHVTVDLEEEVRFADITRGRASINVMPPGDSLEGERFRLTARFVDGSGVTFVLVVHKGRATRQIEVYRDKRTRESFEHELAQEHAKNQQLQWELDQLKHELGQLRNDYGDPGSLRRLIARQSIDPSGIRALAMDRELHRRVQGGLSLQRGVAYRSYKRVTVEVWVLNSGETPWSAVGVSFVDAKGKELTEGIQLWHQDGSTPPNQKSLLVVEVDAKPQELHGKLTLRLRENGPRTLSIPEVVIPR